MFIKSKLYIIKGLFVFKVATEEDHRSGSEDPGMGDEEDKTDCDVFGVTTVLNFTKYKVCCCIKRCISLSSPSRSWAKE